MYKEVKQAIEVRIKSWQQMEENTVLDSLDKSLELSRIRGVIFGLRMALFAPQGVLEEISASEYEAKIELELDEQRTADKMSTENEDE